ncbi:MAG: toprim domain-containing protein [Patescibacteria group bacterium]|nr:toprim domain-containing protein [Patescibacteria group bacterium]
MNSIDKLAEYFSKFPGIGPRQSKRFVHFLLTRNNGFLYEFTDLIKQLKKDVRICEQCSRFYSIKNNPGLCRICEDSNRDSSTLMIVAKDADLENIEKVGSYDGLYFVLGGLLPILERQPEQRIRIDKLLKLLNKKIEDKELKEIILALSLNPEGENTIDYLSQQIKSVIGGYPLKISTLGRGLSTGTELEYLDDNTFENALKNRF